jgi:lysyl-tRNA synthetase class 2
MDTGLNRPSRRPVRIERHPLGARLHVGGFRVHEWHLGMAILVGLAAGVVFGRVDDGVTATLAACAGVWLVAKDWHDLVPSRRDTAAWKLGFHRRPNPLRTFRRADPLPTLAALGAIAVAVVNLVSALTPNVAWRGHALMQIEPLSAMRVSHALAIPVAWVLLVAGIYLGRRRRRALELAIVLLLVLAALNILKGLDVEEAAADLLAAGLLWLGRGSFCVEHDPLTRGRDAMARVGGLAIGSVLIAATAVWIGAPVHTSIGTVLRATGDLLSWQRAPIAFHDELGQLGLTVGILGVMALFACASIVFRPLRGPRRLPDAATRAAAVDLVRRHGSDTLAYFKLRRDKHYLFSPDRSAFVGYRIENGVLLVSGDPIGPDRALPSLMHELSDFAERRALKIAALGVSERLRPLFEQLGLRSLYVGDEAIVDTGAFSLEGRAIRKVRQSVSRLEKAGFAVELLDVSTLEEATLAELKRVSDEWRRGEPERGFSMALDELCCADQADTVVVIGRDSDGVVRAFVQFVRATRDVAVGDAPGAHDPERDDRVPPREVDRAASRPGRARGLAELRRVRARRARASGHSAASRTADDPLRRPVLPDREPVQVQREVLPAVGAALLHVRRLPEPPAGGDRSRPRRGPSADSGTSAAGAPRKRAAAPRYAGLRFNQARSRDNSGPSVVDGRRPRARTPAGPTGTRRRLRRPRTGHWVG